jgi:tetratricopeptide (TPR) repeat protein
MLKRLPVVVAFLLTQNLFSQWLPDPAIDEKIQRGIGFIYNLEFEKANREFTDVVAIRPDHPVGYFFQAMTEWWRILIDLEDESRDQRFLDMLERVIAMCEQRLEKDPNDLTALFFKGGAVGFRGRLRANRGSWLAAARDGVIALPIVRKAAQVDPNNFDVMLGIGIYNYYAEVVPQEYPLIKPLMLFFPSGDRKKGLEQLERAALYAKYAHIEATYFLMQNYFSYEKEYEKAFLLAKRLNELFPRNPIFHRYRGRCLIRLGKWMEAYRVFSEIDKRYQDHQLGYSDADGREASYYRGRFHFMGKDFPEALKLFYRCDELSRKLDREGPSGFMAMANLYIGMIYDLQQKRSLAIAQYQKVLRMKEFENSHQEAQRYLKQPYAQ